MCYIALYESDFFGALNCVLYSEVSFIRSVLYSRFHCIRYQSELSSHLASLLEEGMLDPTLSDIEIKVCHDCMYNLAIACT